MSYKRGDVVLVWFPQSNQQTPKPRPALVVQADNLGTGIPQVVLVMITTNLKRLGHLSRLSVPLSSPAGIAAGLTADSVIMTDNIVTVLERAVISALGKLPDMSAVDAALRHTLGL